MSSVLETLEQVLLEDRGKGLFKNAIVGISIKGHRQSRAFGKLGKTPVNESTIFDVASLTKVMTIWPLVGEALNRGAVRLNDTVISMRLHGKVYAVTLEDLLTHRSGLRQSTRLDLYNTAELNNLLNTITSEELQQIPSKVVSYQSRGYLVLGKLIEVWLGRPLDTLVQSITRHMSLRETIFGSISDQSLLGRTVPLKRAYSGETVRGVAHDRNADILGGVSGQAGLFSSMRDVLRFGEEMVSAHEGNSSLISKNYMLQTLARQYPENDGSRGLSWRVYTDSDDIQFLYHCGFTGCCVVVVPEQKAVYALLTDAVKYGEKLFPMTGHTPGFLKIIVDN